MMNKILLLSLVICSLITFSCNKKISNPLDAYSDSGLTVTLDKEFNLKKKETAILDSKELMIKVLDIMDSRCPVGVNCVRAGEVKFTLLIKSRNKELNTVLAYPAKGRNNKGKEIFEGYDVQLIGANQKNDDKLDPAKLAGIFMISTGTATVK